MAWKDARAAIKALLDTVAITEPDTIMVRRVYEFPPDAVEAGDVPCFIMMPPQREQEWGPAYARIRTYTMRIQCLIRDEKVADAVNITDAFSEAAMDVFIPSFALGDATANLTIVNGPQVDEPAAFTYGNRRFLGFEMHITLRFDENVSFVR